MKPADIRRVAVFRNDRLGDLVCTLPVFEALRLGLPAAHITAIVHPDSAALLAGHPHVDQILVADKKVSTRGLARLLREGRFDAVLMVHCTARNALAALLSRTPIRVTHGRRWFRALCGTHRFYKSRRWPPLHESNFALSFTQRLGLPLTLEQARPQLAVDLTIQAQMRARIVSRLGDEGPLFGVHPGNRASAYNWPVDHYLQTVRRLAAVGRVIVTGSEHDRERLTYLSEGIEPSLAGRVAIVTDLNLPQLVATLSLVDAYLASSTGPLHIASLVSRAAVGLYSDVSYAHPNRWQPIGPNTTILMAHCEAKEPPAIGSLEADAIMSRISVDEVAERMIQAATARAAA
ncbi:MAG TPA: glycosyltransferase family 9 protein [Pirellulales bacterium]|nr:glycosyltransferase family 9 protein [Pirellulales bacterium]